MPAGGSLTISSEQVELQNEFVNAYGYGKPGWYALMTVTDTGAGMDVETLKRIFDPFFTTKEVGKGTGLGLSVVYGIVNQHEGFINVSSEPGRGTIIKTYLPMLVKAGAGVELTKASREIFPAAPRGVETILVAEDDEALREMMEQLLGGKGYRVILAVDGADAVQKFKENKDRVDLLLFDLIMPKKNGKEALDQIRAIRPDIKAIFSSGYTADIIQQKTAIGDDVPLVLKPVSPFVLLETIRSVLDTASRGDGPA
jgi:CheY-like chemotaxis protein